jgi:uncharacterized protein YcbK (DUF882 family)
MPYKYFTAKEIEGLNTDFARLLDIARDIAGSRFIITSGFRTEEENKKVGGLKNSKHLYGEAVDLRIEGGTRAAKVIQGLLKINTFEVIIEEDHIHVEYNPEQIASKLFIRYA